MKSLSITISLLLAACSSTPSKQEIQAIQDRERDTFEKLQSCGDAATIVRGTIDFTGPITGTKFDLCVMKVCPGNEQATLPMDVDQLVMDNNQCSIKLEAQEPK